MPSYISNNSLVLNRGPHGREVYDLRRMDHLDELDQAKIVAAFQRLEDQYNLVTRALSKFRARKGSKLVDELYNPCHLLTEIQNVLADDEDVAKRLGTAEAYSGEHKDRMAYFAFCSIMFMSITQLGIHPEPIV